MNKLELRKCRLPYTTVFDYYTDRDGRVYSKPPDKPLREIIPFKTGTGYTAVSIIHKKGDYRKMFTHHLVMSAWSPKPPHIMKKKGKVVEHKDQDKTNNKYSNLCYMTRSENILAHHEKNSWYKTTEMKRSNGYPAKMSFKDVEEMIELYKTGDWTQVQLSEKYNVTQPHICYLLRHSGDQKKVAGYKVIGTHTSGETKEWDNQKQCADHFGISTGYVSNLIKNTKLYYGWTLHRK